LLVVPPLQSVHQRDLFHGELLLTPLFPIA